MSAPGELLPYHPHPTNPPCKRKGAEAHPIEDHAKNVSRFLSDISPESQPYDDDDDDDERVRVGGMAVMSTQPRDFVAVNAICDELGSAGVVTIPCYGVHPWFLHEAEADRPPAADASRRGAAGDDDDGDDGDDFWWEQCLTQSLLNRPNACVGEIGLDSARYDPATGAPFTPMPRQLRALELQLRIATELSRPVSIHAVRAWGPMLDLLNKRFGKKKGDKPPRMYFHAFGGKPSVVDQIDAACRGTSEVFYGFAPIINFRSPKTADVVRKIGIDRLLLETDHENYLLVKDSLDANASFVAKALGMDKHEIIEKTTANALRFYGQSTSEN